MSIEIPQWVVQDWVSQQQREWEPRLRALDPGLRLIPPFQNPPHPAMLENRWHLARFNEVADREVIIPIIGPEGEFREMDEKMFEALKRMDSHSNRSREARAKEHKRIVRAAAAEKRVGKDDRIGDLADRLATADRVSIAVSRSVPVTRDVK